MVRMLSWTNPRARSIACQGTVVVIVCALVALAIGQTAANLKARGIASGFAYLGRSAGFEIAPGVVSYSSRDTYVRALGVGVANTLRVSVLGVLIATALGAAIGIARLSNIWVVSTSSGMYIEALRNTPLLLQLLFWYALWQALPAPRDALHPFPGVFLCNRGLFLPHVTWQSGMPTLVRPAFAVFGFRGGLSVSPEFGALLIALSTCTSAFIAEIVRGGILAVNRGQTEAAAALGLSRSRALRFVVLPQALPLIVPPTTSQFLNLAKNSSLAVAIGYPDVISITNTTLNQTGQAIEAIAVAMTIYLTISVTISIAMNLSDRREVTP